MTAYLTDLILGLWSAGGFSSILFVLGNYALHCGTVQELLNQLEKYADQMVSRPDLYMFRRTFLDALKNSIWNQILDDGYTTEFSMIEAMYEAALHVDEASWYCSSISQSGESSSHHAWKPAAVAAALESQKTPMT